jgi:MFS transporter, UMF1 family
MNEKTGWYFYDWANSAFYTTVVTLFFGPYITAIAKSAADANGRIYPVGIAVDPRSYFGYLVALSVGSQVLLLPLVGALADHSDRKKTLLAGFAYAGAAATMAMFYLEGQAYLLGGFLFFIANLTFGASIVIYNSFLPDIASPEERDDVSSKGWGIGYLGGGLLLALNLVLYQFAGRFGLTEGQAVRISLASAGAWWAGFTLIPMLALRNRPSRLKLPPGESMLAKGFRQLLRTLADMRKYPQTITFLIAYLLYNDAVQAVIAMASQFGNDELKIPLSTLTMVILMVQFVAFFGSFLFNFIAARMSAKRAVLLALAIWVAILFYIYVSVKTTLEFFILGAIVGIIMGGTQALSRSLFSLMIPKGREAEYFGLYEISDKGTSWLCPLLFGLALQFTGNYRLAILSLLIFFVLGFVVLSRVDVKRAAMETGNV